MTDLKTIVISAVTAALTTLVIAVIRDTLKRRADRHEQFIEKRRNQDINLFRRLNDLLPETIVKGTMLAIRQNAEYYFPYLNGVAHYKIIVDELEEGKYFDTEVEKAHRKFLKSLLLFEKDLSTDFKFNNNQTYRPNKESGMNDTFVKQKYAPLTDIVTKDYSAYRSIVRKKYQL